MTTDAFREGARLHGMASAFDASAEVEPRPSPGVEEVYQSHFKYVHRHLTRLGVRVELVDDAAQDVFMVVHKKLHTFDGKVALTTWLYAIALRVARRYREHQGKRPTEQSAEEIDPATNPERRPPSTFMPMTSPALRPCSSSTIANFLPAFCGASASWHSYDCVKKLSAECSIVLPATRINHQQLCLAHRAQQQLCEAAGNARHG